MARRDTPADALRGMSGAIGGYATLLAHPDRLPDEAKPKAASISRRLERIARELAQLADLTDPTKET